MKKHKSILALVSTIALFFSCIEKPKDFDLANLEKGIVNFKKAQTFNKSDQADSALHYYSIAIARMPDFPPFLMERGGVYASIGQNDKALDDFNKAIDISKGNDSFLPLLYWSRASIHRSMNNLNKACEDWKASKKFGIDSLAKYCAVNP